MKIIALLSSPQKEKSQTRLLVELVLAAAKNEGVETEIMDVAQMNVKYCLGCGVCWNKGECVIKDDFSVILDKIRNADGVIYSSPVYVNNMTAQLKTLFDRMTSSFHCQFLDGKYACSVVTSGTADQDTVVAMLDEFLAQCGAIVLDGLGVALYESPDALEKAKEKAAILGKELAVAICKKKEFPEQRKAREEYRVRFATGHAGLKDFWQHDYQYWLDKGWVKE